MIRVYYKSAGLINHIRIFLVFIYVVLCLFLYMNRVYAVPV